MSNNGHAAPEPTNKEQYRAIREQLRMERMKLELLDTQAKVGLLESVTLGGSVGAGAWGAFVDPMDAYRDADGRQWFTLNNRHDRKDGANRPFVWTDFDLDVIRAQARWVVTKNPLATGALTTFRNFTIRTGYKYEAQPDKRFATNPVALELAYQVQDLVDDFIDLNQWSVRERSAFYRSRRDGEVFIRCFPQDDGTTIVRFVEPEQVRMPTGAPRQYLYGILTDSKDIELPLKYSVQYDVDNPADMEEIDADEIAHLKLNVDECVKRGLSDLYSTGEAFDGVHKLLRNMREAGAIQAAIAWIEQYDNATASQIAGMATTQRDANRAYPDNPITGRPVNLQKMEPGTIVKTQKNKTYVPAPLAGNTTNHAAIVQACLRAIATRWSMPEYMISGDSSNSNYASTLVSGGPFVIAVEAEQDVYRRYFLRIIWTAIRNACERGRLVLGDRIFDDFEELQRLIDINATPPQVAIANKKEEADIDAIDMQNGVMSLQTRRARRGLDNDQEVQNLKKEPPTRVSGKVTDLDSEGDPTKPGAEQEDASAEDENADKIFPATESLRAFRMGKRYNKLLEKHGKNAADIVLVSARRLLEEKEIERAPDGRFGHTAGQHEKKGGKKESGDKKSKAKEPEGKKSEPKEKPKEGEATNPASSKKSAAAAKPATSTGKAKATKGEMAAASRTGKGKDAKLTMADGSPVPPHAADLASKIPPAWTDVTISMDPKSDVRATGRDEKGRPKTVYRDDFHMRNAANKFARVSEMHEKGKEIHDENQANRSDPEKKEHADCVWLMEQQATRPGSDSDTKAKVQAYGATTLRAEHVVETDEGVRLQFVGKEGVKHDHLIRDPKLAAMLLERKKTAGERDGKLFDTSYDKVVEYTKTLDGGSFTPKDFRTKRANELAANAIKDMPAPKNEKEYKAAIKAVAEKVSNVLGNRPQQALESYINPAVFSAWRANLGTSTQS